MKKGTFLTLGLVLSLMSFFGQEMPWTSAPLTWDNFLRRTGSGVHYQAYTQSGISFSFDEVEDSIVIDVQAYMVTDESWVYRDHQTDVLLNHEQLHFDITEWYARKMRSKMVQFVGMNSEEFTRRNYADVVKGIYKDLYNEMQEVQRQYDVDTRHGTDLEAQNRWTEKVESGLSALESFSH